MSFIDYDFSGRDGGALGVARWSYDRCMLGWLRRHCGGLLVAAGALAILPSYVWAYKLSGGSAAPTALMGDMFVVNRAAYDLRLPYSRITLLHTGSPRRGDLVQAWLPMHIGLAIKRVMGLPGETIEVHEHHVVINGRPLSVRPLNRSEFGWVPASHHVGTTVVMEEDHWVAYTPGAGEYRDCGAVKLSAGEYFLMGDNRDNSLDSRSFGPVARREIVGQVVAIWRTGPRVENGMK